ncbi:high affinity cationic amino acid transporter 1-like [Glandiceps talaboti]
MALVVDFLTMCNRFTTAVLRTKGGLERLRVEPQTVSSSTGTLTMFEMTKLGVGNVITIGVFVIGGQVLHGIAGPSATLSFAIAAIASILSGLCYAEFSARVPRKLTTVYTYTYTLVGEFLAFLVGWSLVLMYVSTTAMCARTISATFDYLLGNPIRQSVLNSIGEVAYFDTSPDFLALVLVVIATLLNALGVKQTLPCMDIFTVINITIALFVIAVGAFYVKTEHWSQDGGYFPFGERGVFTGAACCFCAFHGFDIIATAGKNSRRPAHHIPNATSIATVTCFLFCSLVVLIVSLVAPYHTLDSESPIVSAFGLQSINYAKLIVGIGIILAVMASLLSYVLQLVGGIIAMAKDRLIFKFLGDSLDNTNVPLYAILFGGILAGFAALFITLQDLLELVAIAILLIYSIVCAAVIALRYRPEFCLLDEEDILLMKRDDDENIAYKNEEINRNGSVVEQNRTTDTKTEQENKNIHEKSESENEDSANEDKNKESDLTSMSSDTEDEPETDIDAIVEEYKEKIRVAALTYIESPFSRGRKLQKPTEVTGKIVSWSVTFLCLWFLALAFVVSFFFEYLASGNTWVIINICLFGVLSLATICIIIRQPQSRQELIFKVPLMPWLPMMALFINIYLTVSIPHTAWIRFTLWGLIGLSIYLLYGICHSKEARKYMYQLPEEEEEHILLQPMPKYEIMAMLIPTQYKKEKHKRKDSDIIYEDVIEEDLDLATSP